MSQNSYIITVHTECTCVLYVLIDDSVVFDSIANLDSKYNTFICPHLILFVLNWTITNILRILIELLLITIMYQQKPIQI